MSLGNDDLIDWARQKSGEIQRGFDAGNHTREACMSGLKRRALRAQTRVLAVAEALEAARGPFAVALRSSLLAGALALATATASAAPVAAQEGPDSLLAESVLAMERVESARLNGSISSRFVVQGRPISFTGTFAGEHQAPDRIRIKLDPGPLGRLDLIAIGAEAWTRVGEEWEPSSLSGLSLMGGALPGLASYLLEPTVSFEDGKYMISGTLDLSRASSESRGIEAMLALAMPPAVGADWGSAAGVALLTVDPLTFLMEAVDLRLTAPAANGEATVGIRVSFFDFDDPTIQIEPPPATAAEEPT